MGFVYDGKMNYERAKKELDLGDAFTDSELKKAYHRLVSKYHPDINGNTDEEKRNFTEHMKAINDAYQILSGKNENTSKTYDYDVSLEKYKKEKFEQFKNSVHYQDINDIEDSVFQIKLIISFGKIEINIYEAKNINQVDSIIKAAYKTFDDLLTSQVDDFCSQHGITEQELSGYFNLELELKKRTLKQLLTKLKDALQKIKKIKIDETVQKYVVYVGYEDVKNKINFFKQKALSSSEKINDIIVMLQENIDKTFENYFNNMKLIDELIELTKSIDDKEILEELKELIKQVNDYDFKERYDDLKRKISNYNILKEIEELFKNINEKGANALKSCKSLDETTKIYTIFSKSLELIDKIKMKKIPVTDELKDMLNKITFKDFASDIAILDALISPEKKKENIYVKVKNFKNTSDKADFFIEKDGHLYKIDGNDVFEEYLGLDESFISLSEFLASSQIKDIMCCTKKDSLGIYIMYKICTYRDGRSLCFVPAFNEIKIYNDIDLLSYEDYDESIKYGKYQDEEYLTKTILEQVNKAFEKSSGNYQQFIRRHTKGKIV